MLRKILLVFVGFVVVAGLLRLILFWEVGPVPEEEVTYLRSAGAGADSVQVPAGSHYRRGRVGRFFLGGHYREVWATPVRVPVLRMQQAGQNLQVEKKGGGQQTTSFTLADAQGRTFALRSVDKDPLPLLSPFWQQTFAGSFVRDQVAATHPYGALVVPVLAEAVGVFHATPQLVFVPANDPAFTEFPGFAANKLFMLEEKFSKASIPPMLGPAIEVEDSRGMLRKRFRHSNHLIDERAFARARLLDLLIGDWDRHQGQWNWAVYEEGDRKVYRPIPKDRDQAFSYFSSGLIPTLAAKLPPLRKFTSFDEAFDKVRGLTVNAAFIDERALSELTAADFRQIAQDMQASLTDSVISRATHRLPPPVYEKIGPELERKLKSRRDKLPEAAQAFYRVLAEKVTVVGSDEEEKFVVRRLNDQETEVQVFRRKGKGQKGELLYSRVFRHDETEQVTLHGLAGDDEFELTGTVGEGITAVIVGGMGEDKIKDQSSVQGWGKKTIVYDTAEGNKLNFGPETLDRTSSDVSVHAFDREGF